ncbi:MAG TPA: hypothetical protein P5275_15555 [Saprospiraceae bacterium]|nr:hypothetical protein [Saprospiraceae bacterium]HPQ97958.1 hypothetical protein [Saprospiraceae bacterium]HQU52092.1 hypothetical protein [Saprospiraceae bacterium]HRV86290.1 hypothetical protein [Saprospiraceae bacterium]
MTKHKSDIINELEQISPLLAGLKKKQTGQDHEVPAGYFLNLEQDILQRVASARKPNQPTRILHLVRSRWVQIAAAVILVTGAAWWSLRPSNTPVNPMAAEVPPQDIILNYLEQEIGTLDEEDFAQVLDNEDLQDLNAPDIPVDDIRNYLENEAINIEDIL